MRGGKALNIENKKNFFLYCFIDKDSKIQQNIIQSLLKTELY